MSKYIYNHKRGNPDSKYYRRENKLDEDITKNKEKLEKKKAEIQSTLKAIIEIEPSRMNETYEIIIAALIELKKVHGL